MLRHRSGRHAEADVRPANGQDLSGIRKRAQNDFGINTGIKACRVWVLAALFLGLFVYCLVSLIKEANRSYREERNAT